MIDYDEATAIRRSTRLVYNAGQSNFSFLNVLVVLILMLLVFAGLRYAVTGG